MNDDAEQRAARESCGWSGPPVIVTEPALLTSASVFSSPHSGAVYPPSFVRRSRLDPLVLRASEDAFVDDLFQTVPDTGAPLVAAQFPRAFVDVNRGDDELDPALIAVPSLRARTLRVSAGLGVVPRVVSEGRAIYDGKLTMAEVKGRIAACHAPYHRAITSALRRARDRFGVGFLVDCHSMPSEGNRGNAQRAEIVIGDCYGVSCGADVSDAVVGLFRRAGFRVARNAPFAGGYLTHRYGRPRRGYQAIQIEIDRSLYMDEAQVEPSADYADFARALEPVIRGLSDLPRTLGNALAAE
jgi:N-formylglutamate deformylase